MALTDDQKAEVRRFVGYSDRVQGTYSLLEAALISISAEAEAQVVVLLADLADIETELRNSWRLQKAKRAEDVELWGFDQILTLRSEGNRLANMLATVLGVELARNPFSSTAAAGMAGRG